MHTAHSLIHSLTHKTIKSLFLCLLQLIAQLLTYKKYTYKKNVTSIKPYIFHCGLHKEWFVKRKVKRSSFFFCMCILLLLRSLVRNVLLIPFATLYAWIYVYAVQNKKKTSHTSMTLNWFSMEHGHLAVLKWCEGNKWKIWLHWLLLRFFLM